MNYPTTTTIVVCVTALATGGTAEALASPPATQPVPVTQPLTPGPVDGGVKGQPTANELLQEIRLLREQVRDQQRRHEEEMSTLRNQIEDLRRKSGSSDGPASRPGASDSQPPIPTSGPSAEEELLGAIAQSGGGTPASPSQAGAGPLSLQGALQSFNPDISLNGDFLASFSNPEGNNSNDHFIFRELEIGFSGAVDPYTSATAFVSVSRDTQNNDYTTDLEEAYLSYHGLPYGLGARFGQFRAEFGKVNPIHLHALPWTDYPLVIQRYFGDEGLTGAGAELSWLVPNPAKQYFLLTYEIINNDNSSLFAGEKNNDYANIVHAKSFFDLSPTSTLELGASFAEAPNDAGHGSHRSLIEGFDSTYRWKPKEAGLYRSFLFQNEVLFAQVDLSDGQESTWGGYSAAEYQFARQWKFGARYDTTQLPFSSSLHERGYSVYFTFLQSEYVYWRLGYLYTDRNFPQDGVDNQQQLFLQLNWTLGAHPAHKY